MNPDDYQKVKEIFQSVLEIEPGGRGAFLDERCKGEDLVRAEVERLLTSYDSEFLEQPAVANVAEEIAGNGLGTGRQIGRYTIIKSIGKGGMGQVYLAEDSSLARQVALKVLPEDFAADGDRLRRFEQEAKAASALNHPNILTVFEFAADGELHFLAAEFVAGQTLRQVMNSGPLPVKTSLDIMTQVAAALDAAHLNGIIHRDIKPENVMIREDGLVKVLDFGLAKFINYPIGPDPPDQLPTRQQITTPGMIMGTVRYMSPEQARGHATDARTDIWSLGVVLYEMLAGYPTFAGENAADLIAEIVKTHPAPLPQFDVEIPERLDEIVAKTVEKNPNERYQTAKDLLIDLTRLKRKIELEQEIETIVDGVKTESDPNRKPLESLSGTQYVLAGIKLHRGTAIWIFALIAALLLTSAFLARKYWRITDPNEAQFAYATKINLAAQALETSNFGLAKQMLAETKPKEGKEDLRSFEWGYISRLHAEKMASQPLQVQHTSVDSVSFSADSKTLATAGMDNVVRLWNVTSGEQMTALTGHSGWVVSVSFSPDGSKIATGSFDKTAKIWDAETGRELLTIVGDSDAPDDVTFSPDGRVIVFGDGERIRFWNPATGEEKSNYLKNLDVRSPLAFSADGKLFAARRRNEAGSAIIFDVASGRVLSTISGHLGYLSDIKFSPDSKSVLTGSSDGTVRLWNVKDGSELRSFKGHSDEVLDIAFAPNGKIAASSGKDNSIKLWDISSGGEVATLTGHLDDVRALAFSSDGRKLASGSNDNTTRIWNVPKNEIRGIMRDHSGKIRHLAFSNDGKMLASASEDKTAKIWDVETEQNRHTLTGHTDKVNSAAFSPNGLELATGSNDRKVMTWDTVTGRRLQSFDSQASGTFAVLSPDGKLIATSHFLNAPEVRLWDAATGSKQCSFLVGDEKSSAFVVEFSKDGKQVTASTGDGSIRLWDPLTCAQKWTFNGIIGTEYLPKFAPSGKLVAFQLLNNDRSLKLIDAESGKEIASILGHDSPMSYVEFTPDRKRLVTSDRESRVKLWDLATGQELLSITAKIGEIEALAISPDGNIIAAGASDGTIRLFRANEIN